MIKRFTLFFSLISSFLFAQANPDRQDMESLKRWLQDKRLVTMKEIGGDLSISGEVRTEFQRTSEHFGTQQLRGDGSLLPMYAWDIEFNLMLDYRTDRTWTAVKLEYDNDMGQKSGTGGKIRLEKAYLGGRVVAGDTFTMDIELGRRYLSNVFDSKIQFGSIFDGVSFRFNKAFESLGDWYTNLGAFIINDRTNHYGFAAEFGALRIANIGLNLKYSLIDWYRPGGERENGQTSEETALRNLQYRFLISQLSAIYQFYPEWAGKKLVRFYGAALTNHIALDDPLARAGRIGEAFGKQNWAWYLGGLIGTVKKKGDWSVETSFQWVQAQSIPSFDLAGIGRGTTNDVGLYSTFSKPFVPKAPTTKATAAGKTNYYGFILQGGYLITGNFMVTPQLQYSWTLDKSLGKKIQYNQYELEFIYAF